MNQKAAAHRKAVRQHWIEDLVLEYAVNLLQDAGLLESIAESTYQYYLSQKHGNILHKVTAKGIGGYRKIHS